MLSCLGIQLALKERNGKLDLLGTVRLHVESELMERDGERQTGPYLSDPAISSPSWTARLPFSAVRCPIKTRRSDYVLPCAPVRLRLWVRVFCLIRDALGSALCLLPAVSLSLATLRAMQYKPPSGPADALYIIYETDSGCRRQFSHHMAGLRSVRGERMFFIMYNMLHHGGTSFMHF